MQVVKQTSSELSLRNQPSRFNKGLIGLWALLFSGIPLAMMGGWLYGLGVTQLQCQRVEPSQVRCDRTQSRLLGLMPGPSTTVDQVTARTQSRLLGLMPGPSTTVDQAEMKTQTSVDGDGSRHVDYWVVLQTLNGEVTYVEDPIRINGRKGSANEMQAIADQINTFLSSEHTAVTLQRDMRLRLGYSIFPLGFMGLFVLIGSTVVYFTFQSEELVFDKTARQFRCDRKTLFGQRTWQYSLNEIQYVMVDTQTDSNGDVLYALKLLSEQGKLEFIPGPKDQVEKAYQVIHEFLRSSPILVPVSVEN